MVVAKGYALAVGFKMAVNIKIDVWVRLLGYH